MKNTNTKTNISILKKVGYLLLFSILTFSNHGVKGQGFIVRAKTELITNVSATRYTGSTKYVVRFYAATSGTQNITRTLSRLAIEYSFNNTIISSPQVFLVRDGNEFVASNILTAPSTQGNYSISITNPSSSVTNHTRVKVAATRASNPSNTNLDIVATTLNPTSEFMRVYFDVPDASQRPVDNSPVYSNPSFSGYLASVPSGGFGTAPISPASTPWLLWSYSDINTTDWGMTSGGGQVNNNFVIGSFTLGDLAPLPVTYSSLSAKPLANGVKIEWTTTNEENNSHFEVERTNDGENWITIGTVEGNGTTYAQSNYEFMDNNPAQGLNVYRLKQVDWNGDYEYSSNKTVVWGGESVKNTVQIFPNPSASTIHVTGVDNPKVTVYNMAGVVMLESENTNSLDLQHLLRGIYYIQVQDAAGEVSRIRFLKD